MTKPLGLRAEFVASDAILDKLRIIEEFNLAPLDHALLHRAHPTFSQAQLIPVKDELRRFISLWLLFDRETLPYAVPARRVDDVWHEFILHTRCYQAFCTVVFGEYLHHDPADGSLDGARLHESFDLTRDCYAKAYGPPGDFWRGPQLWDQTKLNPVQRTILTVALALHTRLQRQVHSLQI